MWLVNQDEYLLANTDNIVMIYITKSDNSISIRCNNGQAYKLGLYNSEEDAKIALKILSEKLDGLVLNVPAEKEIKAKNVNSSIKEYVRTKTGQKLRRHGGS